MRVIVLLIFYSTEILIVILLDPETTYICRRLKLIGINKILLTKMHMNRAILLSENFRGCQSLQLLNPDYEHFPIDTLFFQRFQKLNSVSVHVNDVCAFLWAYSMTNVISLITD